MLCRIVIVDDESVIRRGLSNTIRKFGGDAFAVAGVAADGYEGLELILREKPEIVISDIRMPQMDGLEMIRIGQQRGVRPRVLFLSGYDEFEYVQDAMNMKASSYCLKPVDPQELMDKLVQMCREIKAEKERSLQLEEGKPLLAHSLLRSLLMAPPDGSEEKILRKAAACGLALTGEDVAVSVFQIDHYYHWELYNIKMERTLCKYAAHNIAQELFCKRYRTVSYYPENDEFVLIINGKIPLTDSDGLRALSRAVCNMVREKLGISVTVGLGEIQKGVAGISRSYHQAVEALSYKFMVGRGREIHLADIQQKSLVPADGKPDAEEYKRVLLFQMRMGNEAAIREEIAKYAARLSAEQTTLDDVRFALMDILLAVLSEFGAWEEKDAEYHKKLYRLPQKLYAVDTIEDAVNVLTEAAVLVCAKVRARRGIQTQQVIRQVKDFLQENYPKETLTLQEAAQYVHISAPYLSALFKKESGKNFVDYLLEIRMKKAMELLGSTDLKLYEIARAVGYSSANYFSSSFKKFTGYSPREYKKDR